jgi:hypothetical protein
MTIGAFALIVLLGGLSAWIQQRLRKQVAALPADARWRRGVVFPAVMGGIVVLFFVVIYLLRPHA